MSNFFFPRKARLFFAAVILSGSVSADRVNLDEPFSVLEQWVRAEQTYSKERADWAAEKATLEDIIDVYEAELAALQERIDSAEEATTEVDRRRVELTQTQDRLREIAATIRAQVEQEEQRLLYLVEYFPRPLREELRPLIQRIPGAGSDSNLSLSQRMQNIVGILSQADNFNNAVTPVSETREFDDGTIAVDTIYFGLAYAYYVDGGRTHAGFGRPAKGGWEWSPAPELADSIADLLGVYRRSVTAKYISLPAQQTEISGE